MTGYNSVIQPAWHHASSKYYHPEIFSPAEFLYLAAQLIAVNSVYVVYHDCNGSSAVIGDNGQVTAVLSAWNVYIFILFEILLDKLGFAIARCSVNIDILL